MAALPMICKTPWQWHFGKTHSFPDKGIGSSWLTALRIALDTAHWQLTTGGGRRQHRQQPTRNLTLPGGGAPLQGPLVPVRLELGDDQRQDGHSRAVLADQLGSLSCRAMQQAAITEKPRAERCLLHQVDIVQALPGGQVTGSVDQWLRSECWSPTRGSSGLQQSPLHSHGSASTDQEDACPAAQDSGQLAYQSVICPAADTGRQLLSGMKVNTVGSNHCQDHGGMCHQCQQPAVSHWSHASWSQNNLQEVLNRVTLDMFKIAQQLRPAVLAAWTSRCMLGQLQLSCSQPCIHVSMQLDHGLHLTTDFVMAHLSGCTQ